MAETLGPFTVDVAEGVLLPALGVEVITNPSPPPAYVADISRAVGVASTIKTARAFADPAAALAEAALYYATRGGVVTFRSVLCMVADVVCDHRAAAVEGGGTVLVAEWKLVANLGWIPV